MTGRRSDASSAPMQGYAAGMGRRRSAAFKDNGFWIERQQEAGTLILSMGGTK